MIETSLALIFLVWTIVVFYITVSAFVGFVRTRVPFVRTAAQDIRAIALELGISKRDIVYELGSGDGSVVSEIARMTGARSVGFELTGWTYLLANLKLEMQNRLGRWSRQGRSEKLRVEFRKEDFFKTSWAEATVIYAYLYPPLMGRLEDKFLAECRPGALAVIRDFPFPNLKPQAVYRTVPLFVKIDGYVPNPVMLSQRERLKIFMRSLLGVRPPAEHYMYVYHRPTVDI